MTTYDKNLTRALAILKTKPDEGDIGFQNGDVVVAGVHLDPTVDEDRAVLEILMSEEEFGFSVSTLEILAEELRSMQRVWLDAERGHKRVLSTQDVQDAAHATEQMTDEIALREIEEAKQILEKHWENGFLLGFWNEQYDGFQYRYADGEYARRAEVTAEEAACR